jgi:hypothetical protein
MTVIEKKFVAPSLPTAPTEYDQRRDDQVNYALRLYFNLLDNYLAQLTTLLNNGGPFDSLTADEFIGGTFDGQAVNATYGRFENFNGAAGTFDAILTKRLVGTSIMAANFYGGTFYGDGRFLQLPYNQIISTAGQTAAALDQAYAITYTSTDFPDGISVVSNSRITFAKQGIYLLTYSIQFESDSNTTEKVDIWLRYKGTDVANSNSLFSLPPRKSAGVPSTLIAVTPIMVDIAADGDYVEIMWHPTTLVVAVAQYPAVTFSAGVTPAIPATPSVILTVQHISAQFPPIQRVAPAPVFGFGEIGNVIVSTNRT